MTESNSNETWLDKLRSAMPAELWTQIDDLADQLKTFSAGEFNCLLERMKAGDLKAAYEQIYAKLAGADVLDAWDKVNAKWQELNEEQYKRLESVRNITLGLLDVVAKIALVGVFL